MWKAEQTGCSSSSRHECHHKGRSRAARHEYHHKGRSRETRHRIITRVEVGGLDMCTITRGGVGWCAQGGGKGMHSDSPDFQYALKIQLAVLGHLEVAAERCDCLQRIPV